MWSRPWRKAVADGNRTLATSAQRSTTPDAANAPPPGTLRRPAVLFSSWSSAERKARQEAAGPVSNQTARQGCTGAAGVEAVRTSPRDTETGIARQIHISLERLGADQQL